MRYHVLACDFDGTLAHHGRVDKSTLAALQRLLATGRQLVLVTGRQLDELIGIFPEIGLFARVVAENGAVLYQPTSKETTVLAKAPPPDFAPTLRERGVAPMSMGHVVVATWRPHETVVLQTIVDLGLEMQVIFNKDAVMVLPSGVNKATGLAAALAELSLSPHEAAGVGDAENDHAFLCLCECAVAVANALPALKKEADLVTAGDHGAGVSELIDKLIEDDLESLRLARHSLLSVAGVVGGRYIRKYAEGDLPPERSFYFRGPDEKLNLRAQNLLLFMQMADGVDDATWIHHLREGDYSRWFRDGIEDDALAAEAAQIEREKNLAPAASRARMRAIIEKAYTLPVRPPLPMPGTDAAPSRQIKIGRIVDSSGEPPQAL